MRRIALRYVLSSSFLHIRAGLWRTAGASIFATALLLLLLGLSLASPGHAQDEVMFWLVLGEREAQQTATPELLARVSHRHDPEFIDPEDKRSGLIQQQGTILRLLYQFERKYNSTHGDADQIRVRVQFISWNRAAYALDWAVRHDGDRPDLVQMPSTWTASYAQQGLLRSIRSLVQDVDAYVSYPRALLESCWLADQADNPYAIPWSIDCRSYYYNVSDFRRAGYDTPLTIKRAFMGLDDLRKACRDVRRLNLPRAVFDLATADDWTTIHDAAPWIWRRGGAYVHIGKNGWESGLADEATREGLFDYVEFAMEFANLPTSPGAARTGAKVDDDFCMGGRSSLISTGQWVIRRIHNLPDQGGGRFGTVAPYLCDHRTPLTFLGGCHLSLVCRQNQRDSSLCGAKALLIYLAANPSVVKEYGYATGYTPAFHGVLAGLARRDLLYSGAAEAIGFGQEQHYPSIPQWRNVEEQLKHTLSEMWIKAGEIKKNNPGSPPLAIVGIAKPEINKILDDGHWKVESILKGPRTAWLERNEGGVAIAAGLLLAILVGVLFFLRQFRPCPLSPTDAATTVTDVVTASVSGSPGQTGLGKTGSTKGKLTRTERGGGK